MAFRARLLVLNALVAFALPALAADSARFDLVGPSIDVRVTRGGETLPIASVPNLQPGDKLWLHPDLPPTQSVHYLLVCVFLRGTTNPPPADWFTRIQTWNRSVRQEGVFVTVPAEAQQAVLFLAPETGGDFSTLRSAVQGRPGIFVRASQDLAEAGFEQARIEKYLASIRRVPPSDSAGLQQHSDLLARTLALKPNADCFKRPVDTQFTCLTQTGTQTLLDDGHGQSIVAALSSGQNSDLIQAASYTGLGGSGVYSAYVGAVVDLIRVMANLHTAKYQYIPAISFPQGQALNLRLNTPPSFHNPKSVLVIGLPAVQAATPPPLRSAEAAQVVCLLQPTVVLPIEGAPLVFSADFAHHLALHFHTPPGAPAQPDIPLIPDAFSGGLLLERTPPRRVELHDSKPLTPTSAATVAPPAAPSKPAQPAPVQVSATIQGLWGFDAFSGPVVQLQQLPGKDWHIVSSADGAPSSELIAGRSAHLLVTSTGSACVHTIQARPTGAASELAIPFKSAAKPDQPNLLELTLPLQSASTPGDLHLAVQQYDQPKADELAARTFSEPASIASIRLHAGDRTATLTGTNLAEVASLTLGDLAFTPSGSASPTTLRVSLPPDSPAPPTHADDRLTAHLTLRDGRTLSLPVVVAAARPAVTLLRKSSDPATDPTISLTNADDILLSQRLTFTLKVPSAFPRNGQVEVETLDGTLRTVLTLAPSGGLLLQDPHTIVATLDPLRSFGPSAFGQLHLRVVFPAASGSGPPTDPASDWLTLGTLVRLPVLTLLQCAPEGAAHAADKPLPCTLSGSNLFLLDSLSTDPAFADPVTVPDGFTGSSIAIPRPTAAIVFLRLRDDRSSIHSAQIPQPATPAAAVLPHPRKPPTLH